MESFFERRETHLVGTLFYSNRDNLRHHVIRGNWKFESPSAAPPERFELIQFIPPEEDLKELPKGGEFNGSFKVRFEVENSKGKIKMKTCAVPESVELTFKPRDGSEGIFKIHGRGVNEIGTFKLYGTATKNASVVEEDPTYKVSVHKRYASLPPTVLPTEGICFRGTLVCTTSDELSPDKTSVVRITGLWSMMGLSVTLDEPRQCEKIQTSRKSQGCGKGCHSEVRTEQ